MTDDPDTETLLRRAAAGDREGWGTLLTRHRDRLRRMIAFRLDHRVRGRVDPDDVLQEGTIDALRRLPDYLAGRPMPFFLWLRFLVGQKLVELERRHLGAQGRAADREVALYRPGTPTASSAYLAARLMGHHTTPSQAAIRAERKARLEEALNAMDPTDREVLVLRHFEHLSNSEAARELGLRESAASKRYLRALSRLHVILRGPGGFRGETG
jgi:RNA polymerase sigma-70 factor (ECF subfamily)